MSHTVKITRRITTITTVNSGSVMGVNKAYLKKPQGLLQMAETVIGGVVTGLCGASPGYDILVCFYNRELFLLIVAVTFLITTFLMFVSNFCHEPTGQAMPKTLFELLYHIFAFILYLAGAITVMVAVHCEPYSRGRYTMLLVAAIFAVVNTILYLVSAIFSYKGFKNSDG